MTSIVLTGEELDALSGLPHAAFRLYVAGLRPHMDYASGVVGDARRISWQMLRELMYVEPHKGLEDSGTPSLGRVRRAMDWLIRAGLVEDIGSKERGEAIIFRLVFALTDSSEQKKPGKNPARTRQGIPDMEPDMRNSSSDAGLGEVPGTKPGKNPASTKSGNPALLRYPLSVEERVFNNTVEFASANPTATASCREVFAHWQAVMGKPRAHLDAKRQKAIQARLKDGYSVDRLKTAIDGCAASAWHQGANDRNRPYNDIELICRDAKRVDQFIEMAHLARRDKRELDAFLNERQTIDGEFYSHG